MKKTFLLVAMCATVCMASAQDKMRVWVGGIPAEYPVSVVDSVTFLLSETPVEPDIPDPDLEPLPGLFSVSADKQVQFSRGNLQYTQSTQTWSFAAQQYEVVGTDNVTGGIVEETEIGELTKKGDALGDKIDVFGWSGSTGTAKWGVSISGNDNDYSGDFVDWGQNIGDGTTWRTLTNDEWTYLFKSRDNANLLAGVARINLNEDGSEFANGLIILPDNWQCPTGISFKSGFADEMHARAYAAHQTFSLAKWKVLEEAGAIFFPTAGGCGKSGGSLYYNSLYVVGGYWSSSSIASCCTAYALGINSDTLIISATLNRYWAYSVRLAKDTQ